MSAPTTTANSLKLETEQNVRVRSLRADAWRRLRKNKLALAGLAVILIFLFMALFGRLLTPYDFLEQDMSSQL